MKIVEFNLVCIGLILLKTAVHGEQVQHQKFPQNYFIVQKSWLTT